MRKEGICRKSPTTKGLESVGGRAGGHCISFRLALGPVPEIRNPTKGFGFQRGLGCRLGFDEARSSLDLPPLSPLFRLPSVPPQTLSVMSPEQGGISPHIAQPALLAKVKARRHDLETQLTLVIGPVVHGASPGRQDPGW